MRTRPLSIGAFALALSCSACGIGEDDHPADTEVTVSQPLVTGFEGVQYGGDPAHALTNAPLASSVCYLTTIGGTLKNTATSLQQVFVTETGSGSFWVAGTSSETRSKYIGYDCLVGSTGITRSQYTTYYWSTSARDPAPVDMGPVSDRVCFLTKVEGWFNGSGEQVRVRASNGRWLLDGTMGTLHNYAIGAGAVCIRGVTSTEYSQEYSVTSPTTGRAYTLLNKSFPQNYCGLTRVGGKFNGSTNDVRASVWLSAQGWLVDASGTDGPVTVGARCITQNALP